MSEWQNFLNNTTFIPHGHCYLWKPDLVGLHIASDLLIALAYYSIPIALLYFVRQRQDLPFHWIFLLFGAFIVACGTTHIMEIWTLWYPIYWVSGTIKAITAGLSLYTADKLVSLLPKALALPSPAQLEAINLKLKQEITDRIKVEEKLASAEQKYRTLVEQIPGVVYTSPLTSTAEEAYISPQIQQLLDIPPQDWSPGFFNSWSDYIHPMDRDRVLQAVKTTISTLHPLIAEYRMITRSGKTIWVQNRANLFLSSDGQTQLLQGIAFDITERKEAQEALRLSEARYRAILEDQTDLIARYLPDGTVTFVNQAYCRFFGTVREEIVDQHYSPVIFEEDREDVAFLINTISASNPVVTVENRVFVHGEVRWTQWVNRGIFDENGQIVEYQGVGRDISQRKRIEEALKASEHFLQKVAHTVPQVLYLLDLSQNTTIYLNRQCDAVLGYSPEEIYSSSGDWLINCIHPDDRHLYYNITSRFINLTDNEILATEYRFRHKNGEWRWLQAREVVFARDANGVPTQILGAIEDISVSKMAEVLLAQAKEAAEAANKAKSVFLANMSHELRTPLNVILGFSRLMSNDTNFSKEQQENLNIICRSGEHLLALINQVLELSKIEAGRETLNESNFDLYYLLVLLEDMFSLKAKDKGLQLTFEHEANVPQYIRTDEAKLRQVLINLLNNAIKFTDAGRVSLKVSIDIREMGMDNPTQLNEENSILSVYNTHLICEISDTGVGIAPEEFDKLFKPFVQTTSSQQAQEGTGLGLAISCQFVHLMGGEITVISHGQVFTKSEKKLNVTFFDESQKGATFKINIPVGICNENEVEKLPQSRRAIGLAPNEPEYRMLVVDDNYYNRKLLVKILANLNFQVREACDGKQAIEIWQSWEPHLIWMDMRMPVMDGYEATKQIKATTKGQATAVIAITASVLEEEKTVILSAGCDDFVRKPFQEQTIFDIMTKHLGVSYVYESLELDSHPENVAGEPLNLTSVLTAMSRKWIVKLHQAALDADSDKVSKLLGEIPSSYVLELQTLRDWVKKFEFEKILDLTELFLLK